VKVIFPDIDGVLNTRKTVERWGGGIGIDEILAQRFSRLQHATGTGVVLSSTWRLSRNWKANMRRNGVIGIIDRTPDLRDQSRGEEIQAWLDAHPRVQVYAILDDARDFLEAVLPRKSHSGCNFILHETSKAWQISCKNWRLGRMKSPIRSFGACIVSAFAVCNVRPAIPSFRFRSSGTPPCDR